MKQCRKAVPTHSDSPTAQDVSLHPQKFCATLAYYNALVYLNLVLTQCNFNSTATNKTSMCRHLKCSLNYSILSSSFCVEKAK